MKLRFYIVILFLCIGFFALAQDLDTISISESARDSLRLQEALEVLKEYQDNERLRQALVILKENIEQDKTGEALKVLQQSTGESLVRVGDKGEVDSLVNSLAKDEYFQWFQQLTQDSLEFTFYDVQGNQTKIWTNTPEIQSKRYWLYKSPTDSLGFWLHSLPEKAILLEPDFDIYQESQYTELRSSLMVPIPIKENPEEFRLGKFMKYPKIVQPWNVGVVANIGFSQAYFEHWAKGGENNIAVNTNILARANYERGKTVWENYLRWKYGIIQSDEIDEFIRNEDLLELNSKIGVKASKKWYYSAQLNLKTQLFNRYSYTKSKKIRVSDFLSPGNLSLAFGMDYKPSKHFSLLLSPITGRLIYMNDTSELDETTYGLESGKHSWQQLGPYLKTKWDGTLFKSVTAETVLELFSNYFDKFGNVDVDWTTSINMQINYFMSTRLSFQAIYDDDTEIPLYENVNGVKTKVGIGQRLQFNENLSVGLVFRL